MRICSILFLALFFAGCGLQELWVDEGEDALDVDEAEVGAPIWAGKAAWSDAAAVKAELQKRVAQGEVPYVFFYFWGDGPGRKMSDFQNATSGEIAQWEAFAKAIAEGIGKGRAYVVLEPEWDVNPAAASSPKFKQPLFRIIGRFRAVGPNALLVNGPGLWKPDSAYAGFNDAPQKMDLQGFLLHVTSNHGDCTWRSDGSRFSGGTTLTEALKIEQHVRERIQRVKTLFAGGRVILTDLA
jgi:hypothetical protein